MTHFQLLEQVATKHKIKRGSLIALCLHFYCEGFQSANKDFTKHLKKIFI